MLGVHQQQAVDDPLHVPAVRAGNASHLKDMVWERRAVTTVTDRMEVWKDKQYTEREREEEEEEEKEMDL